MTSANGLIGQADGKVVRAVARGRAALKTDGLHRTVPLNTSRRGDAFSRTRRAARPAGRRPQPTLDPGGVLNPSDVRAAMFAVGRHAWTG